MQESTPSGPILGGRIALAFGGIALGALVLIIAFGAFAKGRVGELETFVERSALGDSVYFQRAALKPAPGTAPEGTDPAPPVAAPTEPIPVSINGHVYVVANSEPQEFPETRMIRLATDAKTGLSVYRVEPPKKASAEKKAETGIFLKVGPGEFIKVSETR